MLLAFIRMPVDRPAEDQALLQDVLGCYYIVWGCIRGHLLTTGRVVKTELLKEECKC